jgi:Zn-dependent M28 family amino/carboxypeptidase
MLFVALFAALVVCWFLMIRMPGTSFRGPLPLLTDSQAALADELRRDVDMLAGVVGRRSLMHSRGLEQSVQFLEQSLSNVGYAVQRQTFEVREQSCSNLIVEIKGATQPDEVVVVGAHYDSCDDSPAANDNGSGVAALLALARRFAPDSLISTPLASASLALRPGSNAPPQRTLRFVLFVNEEPPFFQTDDMGSLVYARACRANDENIVAMLSLETIGYYSDEPGSQIYPIKPIGWLYPKQGNFIAFVGNVASRRLVRQAIGSFRARAQFPSQGAALPGWITGVDWSDQWSFWQCGYPGIMVTDTALFRYPYYHQITDTPDKLDYQRMARVVDGLEAVVRDLVAPPTATNSH